jgi:ribonuclease HI
MELYFDGSASPKGSGCGYILLNNNETIDSGSVFLHKYTVNQAEYTGLIKGLIAAMAHTKTLKVYGDSELVIRQMNGIYQVRHPRMIPLYTQAMTLATQYEDIEFHHIPRELNTLADALARNALKTQ